MDDYEKHTLYDIANKFMELLGYIEGQEQHYKNRTASLRLYKKTSEELPSENNVINHFIKSKKNQIKAVIIDETSQGGENELSLKYGDGTISKRSRINKNGSIYVYWQGSAIVKGKRRTATASTKNQILTKLKNLSLVRMKSSLAPKSIQPKTNQPKQAELTLNDWLIEWLTIYRMPNIKISSQKSIRNTIDNHISPILGNYKLAEINSDIIQAFFSKLPAKNTRNKIHNVMNASFRKAYETHKISENPMLSVEIKKVKSKKRSAFTFEEQTLIIENCKEAKYKALFIFLCCTGLRIGEFLSLTEKNVNYKNNFILIDTSLDRYSKENGTTKTHTIRQVAFHPDLFEIIHDILGDSPFFGEYTYNACKTYLYRLFKRLQLPSACIHSTRHTFASVCYYADIPDKKIQKWLGHATIAMTLDTYTDLYDDGTSVILEYIKKLAK